MSMSNRNRATDTFRLTLETIPGQFNESHAAIQIENMDNVLSVEPEAVCPVCGSPFTDAGRVGYVHPIELDDDVVKVCLGPKDEFDDGVGGLAWMYTHAEGQV